MSFFISKRTLYKISLSEKSVDSELPPLKAKGRRVLASGKYRDIVSASTSRCSSNRETCSAIFFNCRIFPGNGYRSNTSWAAASKVMGLTWYFSEKSPVNFLKSSTMSSPLSRRGGTKMGTVFSR